MTVKVNRRFDSRKFSRELIEAAQKSVDVSVSDEVAEMVKRTQSGRDVSGQPFRAYTKEYAAMKNKRGRSTRPDLTFTGRMLANITHRVKKVGSKIVAEIFFSSAKEAAKAQGNLQHRDFFGFSKDQLSRIKDRLESDVSDALKRGTFTEPG